MLLHISALQMPQFPVGDCFLMKVSRWALVGVGLLHERLVGAWHTDFKFFATGLNSSATGKRDFVRLRQSCGPMCSFDHQPHASSKRQITRTGRADLLPDKNVLGWMVDNSKWQMCHLWCSAQMEMLFVISDCLFASVSGVSCSGPSSAAIFVGIDPSLYLYQNDSGLGCTNFVFNVAIQPNDRRKDVETNECRRIQINWITSWWVFAGFDLLHCAGEGTSAFV